MRVLARVGMDGGQVDLLHAVTAQVRMVSHGVIKVLPPTGLDTLGAAEHPVLVILDLKVHILSHKSLSPASLTCLF